MPFTARDSSLRTWITTGLFAALLSAVLSCVLVIEHIARGHAQRNAIDALTQVADGFRDDLDRGMGQYVDQVEVLAGLDQIAQTGDPDAVRRALDRMQHTYPQYTWIGLAGTDGRVIAAAGKLLEGQDVSMRPWFANTRDGSTYVGDVHAAVLLDKILPATTEPRRFVDVSVPVFDRGGQRVGTLGAHMSWSWARQVKSDLIASLHATRQADAMVLAHDGTVLIGPPGTEGKRWQPADGDADFTAALPTRGRGAYPGLGWTVVVRQPRAVAMADYRVLQRQIGLTAAGLLLLCIPFAAWLARRLSAPLRALADAISRQEHLGAQALPRIAGYREIGLVSDALAALARRHQTQDAALRDLNASLEQRVAERTRQLSDATDHLQSRERLLRDITDNLPVLISYIDREQKMAFANATFRDWMSFEPQSVIGKRLVDFIDPAVYAQREPHLLRALGGERCEFEVESQLLGVHRVLKNIYIPDRLADGSVVGIYALSSDITPMKLVERHLEQLTRVDSLTGLPNRRQFEERLDEAMMRAERSGRPMALMFLDIDKFKHINDSLGHAGGDDVLKTVAARLSACVRVTDTAARLAGDEFVVILEGLNSTDEAQFVARKILRAVHEDTLANGHVIQVSTSIGIAFFHGAEPDHAADTSAAVLVAQADAALYEAKAAGRNTFRSAARQAEPQDQRVGV